MKQKKTPDNFGCLKKKSDCGAKEVPNFRSSRDPRERFSWDWIKRHGADPEARALLRLSLGFVIKPNDHAGYKKIREWLHGIEASPGYYSMLVSLERKYFYLNSKTKEKIE